MFFNFDYKGYKLLVPVPDRTDEQKKYNIANYGNEYGIMQVIFMDGTQEHRIMSSDLTYAPDELHQTSTTTHSKLI